MAKKVFMFEGTLKTWVLAVQSNGECEVSTVDERKGFREWDGWTFRVTEKYMEEKLFPLLELEAELGEGPRQWHDWRMGRAISNFVFAQ